MKKLTLLFTALWTALLLASTVYAADIRLSSSCSLADAIIAANSDQVESDCPASRGADTITLSQDITLDDSLPKITSDITIEGEGYIISGGNRYRIFYNDGGALTINNLTMAKGYVEGDLIRYVDRSLKNATANPIGAAIVNWKGWLSIINSSFSDNVAEYYGGAIANAEYGTLSITNSSFSGNLAERGGAIYNWEEGELSITNSRFSDNAASSGALFKHGGAIYNRGELGIVNSTFNDNSADDGGAIHNYLGELNMVNSAFSNNSAIVGGAIHNWYGELSISDSTFSNNSASSDGAFSYGGAIYNSTELSIANSSFSHNSADHWGGAIYNTGELSMVNSTFSNNSADHWGGAIANGEYGELSMVNSSFSNNSADDGGAIISGGELSLINSIIAGGGENACYSDNRLRHNINNFIQDGSCSPAFSGDPKLGELVEPADGSPAYFPLLAGSRAIDAADDGYCPETDQIGAARPQGSGCDIGAIEYAAS